ncbi:class I SAM-dependent methyltransferase [Nitrosopumilus sp. K4]|uniref:class I SAM-dependent methyltransferase n=1 Tax=Nitrosopumilus sp. K4 TaxID=2795383 RepID=UPI001BAAD23C|nr:class I SAM-dependent methyltransferase [Nitrosopumilus sp. K4]QUC64452.1 class I SAM-dependent methyltransferase [Nitrosopumilus sp. K4]
MENKISKKILDYYQQLFDEYGVSPQSLGWGPNKGKQSIRFKILCQIGELSNTSILDVGCGFGDLFGYLRYQKIKVNYHGIDINKNLVNVGKIIYPSSSLECRDFEKKKFKKKFDWVLASGITSHGSTYPHLTSIMKEMFRICKKGFSINFVSDNVDYRTKDLFYSSSEKIISITKSISNRFILRHDYMPFEFTLYVYKNNKRTKNHIFTEVINNSKSELDDCKWLPYNRN